MTTQTVADRIVRNAVFPIVPIFPDSMQELRLDVPAVHDMLLMFMRMRAQESWSLEWEWTIREKHPKGRKLI